MDEAQAVLVGVESVDGEVHMDLGVGAQVVEAQVVEDRVVEALVGDDEQTVVEEQEQKGPVVVDLEEGQKGPVVVDLVEVAQKGPAEVNQEEDAYGET